MNDVVYWMGMIVGLLLLGTAIGVLIIQFRVAKKNDGRKFNALQILYMALLGSANFIIAMLWDDWLMCLCEIILGILCFVLLYISWSKEFGDLW